jgi:Na+-driven multidrug efflux pump
LILGAAWMSAVPLFKIFVINMAIGALIAVLVAYLRAVGDAKATTHASLIQMVILFAIVPPATHYWGVTGIAWSMTVGMGSAAMWMLYRTLRRHDDPVREKWTP